MSATRKAGKPLRSTPKKSETRTTAPTVPGLNVKKQKQADDNGCAKNGKVRDSRAEVVAKAKGQTIAIAVHVTSHEKIKALIAIRDAMPGNTAATQEQRLLAALAKFSLSTYEASRYIDAYDPRARVMGLRNKGHNILTSWVMASTECGRLHRIGIYTLLRGSVAAPTGQRHPANFTPDLFEGLEV